MSGRLIPSLVLAERDEFVTSIKRAANARLPYINNMLLKSVTGQLLLSDSTSENPKNKYQEARLCIDAYNYGIGKFPCAKVVICLGLSENELIARTDYANTTDWRNVTLYIRSDSDRDFILATIKATSIGTCLVDPADEQSPCKFIWSDYASTGSVPSLQRIREKHYSTTFDKAFRPVVLTQSVCAIDIICGYYVRQFDYTYVLEVMEGYGITTIYAFNAEDISWDPMHDADVFPMHQTKVDKMVVDAIEKFNHDGVHFNHPNAIKIRAQGQLDCNRCIRDYIGKMTDLKYCSACIHVKYCSVDCQRADWAQHKKICPLFGVKK